jgi:hypothetical protein
MAFPGKLAGVLAGAAVLQGAAPAPDDNWHMVPFGVNAGFVQSLYVERRTVMSDGFFKYAWIFETFDTGQSPYANKKERVQFDCLRRKYRGVVWYWVDLKGRYLTSDKEDVRFNEIGPDTPMEAALTFVCEPGRFTEHGEAPPPVDTTSP